MNSARGQDAAAATGWSTFSREEVLSRIETLAAEFLERLSKGEILEFEAVSGRVARFVGGSKCIDVEAKLKRNSSALIYDHENQRQIHGKGKRVIKLNRHGGRRYTGIWLILQTAHALLTESKTATQRDVYYLHPFFKGQNEADEAILDAGSILGVPRGSLNIIGATKGCFTGDLSVLRDGQWRHFGSGEEVSITQELLQLKPSSLHSNAKFIIVIEKDGIFNRLREDKFFEKVPSILITGRGFPDLATRMFVSLLSNALGLPVLGLCDCNPFGLSIMVPKRWRANTAGALLTHVLKLTYKLGSARMPIESLQYAVDIKWIGLRPSQIARLGLPQSSLKMLTLKDIAVADSLMRASFIQSNERYKNEVILWLDDSLPWKIELEALHSLGFTFLSSFLQDSIEENNFL